MDFKHCCREREKVGSRSAPDFDCVTLSLCGFLACYTMYRPNLASSAG